MNIFKYTKLFLLFFSVNAHAGEFDLELPKNPDCPTQKLDYSGLQPNKNGCSYIKFSNTGSEPRTNKWWRKSNKDLLNKNYPNTQIKYITYHHQELKPHLLKSHQKNGISTRVDNINTGHVDDEKWGTIAYHMIVDNFGNIARGRPIKYRPATGASLPQSKTFPSFSGHMTVMILGNYNEQKLSTQGRLALVRAMSAGQLRFRVRTDHIRPHKDHVKENGSFGTSCPGDNIYVEKDNIAEMVLVHSIQTLLSERGCNPGKIDGKKGSNTYAALSKLLNISKTKASEKILENDTLFQIMDNKNLLCKAI